MTRRISVFATLAVLVAGCSWPMAGHGPTRDDWSPLERALTPTNTGRLRIIWGPIPSTGEVVGNRDVVFTRAAEKLTARDPATGTERWHVDVEGTTVPAITEPLVTIASGGATCLVEQRDLATGALRGRARIGTEFTGAPLTTACATGGSVMIDDGHTVVTTASLVTRNAPGCASATPPQLWGETTTVTVLDARLRAVWEASDAHIGCGTPPGVLREKAPDVARAGAQYVVTRGGDVLGFPRSCAIDCRPAWIRTRGGHTFGPIGLVGGQAAVQVQPGFPTVLDAATGAVRWTGTGRSEFFAPAATDRYLFTPGTVLRAYAVGGCGAATCAPVWTADLDTVIPTAPLSISGDVLFAGRWEQDARLFDARGCGAAVCPPIGSMAPAYAGRTSAIAGRIFVPALEGLYAYTVADP